MITSRWRSASARIFSPSAAALRTQLVGHLLALGLHAAVDRVGDVGDEVHALDAHVDDLDAEGLGLVGQAAAHVLHDLVALGGQHARTSRLVISSLKAACTTGLRRLSRLRSRRRCCG
jgi:hypothetical protein